MLSIASVVMNDGIRNRSDIQPFHQPMSRPIARMRPMAGYGRHLVAHEQERDAGRRERHDRADGQVDAADDDDQQHAHRQDARLGDVPGDVGQVALAQEQVRPVPGGRER